MSRKKKQKLKKISRENKPKNATLAASKSILRELIDNTNSLSFIILAVVKCLAAKKNL